MPTISADELALLRDDWDAGLTDTGTIQRATLTRTAGGGTSETWLALSTGPCKVLPGKGGIGGRTTMERDQAGRLVAIQPWDVNLPTGTDVDHRDRIVVGTRTLEVLGVLRWESNEVGRTALCVEVLA